MDSLLESLARAAADNPHLRLGQLLVAAAGNRTWSHTLFYMSDEKLATALESMCRAGTREER